MTNDSASVTLSTDAVPTDDMRFNEFSVSGDSETYTIMAVNESTRVLTLDRPYEGSTAGTASYTVKDVRDQRALYGSEENNGNAWPAQNTTGGVDLEDDDEGITALHATRDALAMWSRTSVYRVTGGFPWAIHKVVGGKGAVSQSAVIERNGLLYWLSPDASVYEWPGSGPARSVTTPRSEDGAFGVEGLTNRINWRHAHLITGFFCQKTRTFRWNVPLDGAVTPNYALVLDASRPGSWTMEPIPDLTAIARVTGADGEPICLAGDCFGIVWHMDLASAKSSKGAFGFEPTQALASGATSTTASAKTGTPFPTSGNALTGVPCALVYATGSFSGNRIISNTSSQLTFARVATAPSEDDQVIVGSPLGYWKSGLVAPGDMWDRHIVRDHQLIHSHDSLGEYHYAVRRAEDTALAIATGDNTKGTFSDTRRTTMFKVKKRSHGIQFQITMLHPGTSTAAVRGGVLNVSPREP